MGRPQRTRQQQLKKGAMYPSCLKIVPLPTAKAGLNGIAVGKDKALWFTEFNTDKIGRLDPQGFFTEYGVLVHGSQPVEITRGNDGALWFTELNADSIGRLTPSGHHKEFPLPTPNAHPVGIVPGTGDSLWFTEAFADNIGLLQVSKS